MKKLKLLIIQTLEFDTGHSDPLATRDRSSRSRTTTVRRTSTEERPAGWNPFRRINIAKSHYASGTEIALEHLEPSTNVMMYLCVQNALGESQGEAVITTV